MKNSCKDQPCQRLDIAKDIRSMARKKNPNSQERVFMTQASKALEEGNVKMAIQLLERICPSLNLLLGERTRLELYVQCLRPSRFRKFMSTAFLLFVKMLMSIPLDNWISCILCLWKIYHESLSVFLCEMKPNEYTIEQLASDLEFQSPEVLLSFARKAPGMYRSWKKQKDDDHPEKGSRTICSPRKELKKVQRLLLNKVLYSIKTPDFMGAGKGATTLDYMRRHLHKEMMLSYDIYKFFPSVSSKSILRALRDRGVFLGCRGCHNETHNS